MKKLICALGIFAMLAVGACTTNIAVESSSKIATYDEMSGNLKGDFDGYSLDTLFKATNIALEKDLKYFRVGQKQITDGWKIYARAELDYEIIVMLKQKKSDKVQITISYDDGNLMKSQEIFNAIARNARMLGRN